MCNISEGKDYFTQKIKFPQSRYRNWNSFAHAHLDTDQMYWGESLLWHTTGLQPTQQKHETFTQCWVKVGPIKINLTLGQRLVFAGYTPHETWWRSHVYWFCVETTCRMTYFRRHQTHENCTHVFVFVFFQPAPRPPPPLVRHSSGECSSRQRRRRAILTKQRTAMWRTVSVT